MRVLLGRAIGGCLLLVLCGLDLRSYAGGSGLNTVVVVNQNSSNSCEVANYFCERRHVPPNNVLGLHWTGGNVGWMASDFQDRLLNPLLSMLAARQLTNQIDYVVLCMDIPFSVTNDLTVNSTTAALFYGLKVDLGPGWMAVTNSYAGSEQIFRQAPPASAPGYSFLTTMLTGNSVADVKAVIDQGVNSDGTFPASAVLLAKSSDPSRNLRYHEFDNAIFNARLNGNYAVVRTNLDSIYGFTNLLGYETGLAGFSVSPGTFAPGAMADSLTSFGGVIFGETGQTSLLAFLAAGATASYGTVTEPSPVPAKFPNAQNYFYQERGFTLAESYYQSVHVPYEGLIVGEPLAAPFAAVGTGAWVGVAPNAVLQGITPLSLRFAAADANHPLQQVDLFVDGNYVQTLTNVAPTPGNELNLHLNRTPLVQTVETGDSLASLASGLAALIVAKELHVVATAFGDRVEIVSLATNLPSSPAGFHVFGSGVTTNQPGGNLPLGLAGSASGAAPSLTTYLSASRNSYLNSKATGIKACQIDGTVDVGTWVSLTVTKNNGVLVSLSVTNFAVGASPLSLAGQLTNAINAAPALQGPDGIVAEDLSSTFLTEADFNLRARSPGRVAANVSVELSGPVSLALSPGAASPLNDNQLDLQPRNQLYVKAGVTNLALTFALDTRTLADGFHELTAVAYEGSHIRTQTHAVLPVTIRNSSLGAQLSLMDLTDLAPVQGLYHLQVAVNTPNVDTITLYGTGGALGAVANQATAVFTISGASLGVGLHPFYAVVQTLEGTRYRTPVQWVRLVAQQVLGIRPVTAPFHPGNAAPGRRTGAPASG